MQRITLVTTKISAPFPKIRGCKNKLDNEKLAPENIFLIQKFNFAHSIEFSVLSIKKTHPISKSLFDLECNKVFITKIALEKYSIETGFLLHLNLFCIIPWTFFHRLLQICSLDVPERYNRSILKCSQADFLVRKCIWVKVWTSKQVSIRNYAHLIFFGLKIISSGGYNSVKECCNRTIHKIEENAKKSIES